MFNSPLVFLENSVDEICAFMIAFFFLFFVVFAEN